MDSGPPKVFVSRLEMTPPAISGLSHEALLGNTDVSPCPGHCLERCLKTAFWILVYIIIGRILVLVPVHGGLGWSLGLQSLNSLTGRQTKSHTVYIKSSLTVRWTDWSCAESCNNFTAVWTWTLTFHSSPCRWSWRHVPGVVDRWQPDRDWPHNAGLSCHPMYGQKQERGCSILSYLRHLNNQHQDGQPPVTERCEETLRPIHSMSLRSTREMHRIRNSWTMPHSRASDLICRVGFYRRFRGGSALIPTPWKLTTHDLHIPWRSWVFTVIHFAP